MISRHLVSVSRQIFPPISLSTFHVYPEKEASQSPPSSFSTMYKAIQTVICMGTEQGGLESTSSNSSRSIRDINQDNLDCFDGERNVLIITQIHPQGRFATAHTDNREQKTESSQVTSTKSAGKIDFVHRGECKGLFT